MPVPSDIAGLQGWWKADAIVGKSDGDSVSQWDDSHTTANHLTVGFPLYKTDILNGLPVVRFDGVDDRLEATFTLSQPTTVFVVARYRSARVGNDTLFDGATQNTMRCYRSATGSMALYAGGVVGDVEITVDPEATARYYTAVFDGASSSLRADAGAADTGNPGTGTPGGFTLASHGDIGEWGPVDVGEAFVFDTALSVGDQQSMEQYLSTKWLLPPEQTAIWPYNRQGPF